MFKFLHAADIHLDSPLLGLSRYENAPLEEVRGACRKAFENLVNLALEEQVSFILLSGDLYDGDWKDYSTGIFLSQQLGRVAREKINVYVVAGNHDAANRMTKSLSGPDNVKIFSSKEPETVLLNNLPVAIHGQGYQMQHVYENLAAGYRSAVTDRFNIGLLHTSLDGREGHASYAPCSLDDLKSKGYHYWALGHVHQDEIVERDPWIVYPGCIQGRHIKETGQKGCMLVHVDELFLAKVEKVCLDVLRWEQCRVDLSSVEDMEDMLDRTRSSLIKTMTDADGRFIAVRVFLDGATGLAEVLAANPERLEQQIRATAAEVAGGDIWIEKIVNRLQGRSDLGAALIDNSLSGTLLRDIVAFSPHPDERDKVAAIYDTLKRKLPPEVVLDERESLFTDPDSLTVLVDEAKQMLIGKLLIERSEK